MTSSGSLTGDDVRHAIFAKPPFGKRGYDSHQVDAFLQRVAATLDGSDSLTADEVRTVVFRKPPVGERGYREDEVDAFLDLVTVILRERADDGAKPPAATVPSAEPLSGYQVRQTVLATSLPGTAGYDRQQVDGFLQRAADTLDGSGVPLSLEQVQAVGFDRAKGLRRGYRINEVDALLDRIATELRRRAAGW